VPPSIAASFLARLDCALDADQVFTSLDARETALAQFEWDEGDIFLLLRLAPEGGTYLGLRPHDRGGEDLGPALRARAGHRRELPPWVTR
jgi:hypothetical protein